MSDPPPDTCDHCGSTRLEWRKCKEVCLDCGQINRSCADLADVGGLVLRVWPPGPDPGTCAPPF